MKLTMYTLFRMMSALPRHAMPHQTPHPLVQPPRNLYWQWRCVRIAPGQSHGAPVLRSTLDHLAPGRGRRNREVCGCRRDTRCVRGYLPGFDGCFISGCHSARGYRSLLYRCFPVISGPCRSNGLCFQNRDIPRKIVWRQKKVIVGCCRR